MISFYLQKDFERKDIPYYPQGFALLLNQNFAFKFLCENFQPKLIISYSNCQRIFYFLQRCLGHQTVTVLLKRSQVEQNCQQKPRPGMDEGWSQVSQTSFIEIRSASSPRQKLVGWVEILFLINHENACSLEINIKAF